MIKITFKSSILVIMLSVLFIGQPSKATNDQIGLTADVGTSLTLGLSGATLDFGSFAPGTPQKGNDGVTVSVVTSAANGYTLAVNDNVVGSDSALLHTDTTTRIADYSSAIASPTLWDNGVDTGLGFSTFAADTTKETKWGSGDVYDSANNKYAGIPQNATVFHTSAAYKSGADTTSITFILDVPADQKTGSYSGTVTITATALLT